MVMSVVTLAASALSISTEGELLKFTQSNSAGSSELNTLSRSRSPSDFIRSQDALQEQRSPYRVACFPGGCTLSSSIDSCHSRCY